LTTVGVFQVGLGVVMTFRDVRSYPLLFGLSSFMYRMELPDENSRVLWN